MLPFGALEIAALVAIVIILLSAIATPNVKVILGGFLLVVGVLLAANGYPAWQERHDSRAVFAPFRELAAQIPRDWERTPGAQLQTEIGAGVTVFGAIVVLWGGFARR